MKKLIISLSILSLVLVLSTSAYAFTPTRYSYTTLPGQGQNPITSSVNVQTGYVNNAINMAKQDVSRATEFIKDKVRIAKGAIEIGQYNYNLIKDKGVPATQERVETFFDQSKEDVQNLREDYNNEKQTAFTTLRDRAKLSYKTIKDRITKRVNRRVPPMQKVIWKLENSVNKILRKSGLFR